MDGILLFNKPILWTSHDAVDFVRRRVGQRSVGHAGTLDPMATGLLVVLIGKATKLSAKLMDHDKDYRGVMTFGIQTDTQDLEGRITSEEPPLSFEEAAIREIFRGLEGAQEQKPPLYSAVKQGGRKLYDSARRGIAVEPKPRSIFISKFELLCAHTPDAHFFLSCSKGTYVRSLCEEAGRRLGCGAVLSALSRTRVGDFYLKDAVDEHALRVLSLDALERTLLKQ